jgi:hypothetical protein
VRLLPQRCCTPPAGPLVAPSCIAQRWLFVLLPEPRHRRPAPSPAYASCTPAPLPRVPLPRAPPCPCIALLQLQYRRHQSRPPSGCHLSASRALGLPSAAPAQGVTIRTSPAPPCASSAQPPGAQALDRLLLAPRHALPPATPPLSSAGMNGTETAQNRTDSRRIFLREIRSLRCIPVVSKVWNGIPSSSSFICPASRDLSCPKSTGI